LEKRKRKIYSEHLKKKIGDKGYKGCKKVCEDKQEKSKRQIIEAVNSQIKNFNLISR
jgi:hypothetical protein